MFSQLYFDLALAIAGTIGMFIVVAIFLWAKGQ